MQKASLQACGLAARPLTGVPPLMLTVTAASSVANVVKTSLGPIGLDKMLVDDLGEVTITNDGATILDMLEVEHPAARVLVQLSEMQDKEVGDGTTSVVIVAAELLKVRAAGPLPFGLRTPRPRPRGMGAEEPRRCVSALLTRCRV